MQGGKVEGSRFCASTAEQFTGESGGVLLSAGYSYCNVNIISNILHVSQQGV